MARRGICLWFPAPRARESLRSSRRCSGKHPDVHLSVSCTTRAPRPGEVDGVSYHFVDDARFDELVAANAFYEWAHVHQNRYGTLKSAVQQGWTTGTT